jgi:hypothetical protein
MMEVYHQIHIKETPWHESASEQYRPSEHDRIFFILEQVIYSKFLAKTNRIFQDNINPY